MPVGGRQVTCKQVLQEQQPAVAYILVRHAWPNHRPLCSVARQHQGGGAVILEGADPGWVQCSLSMPVHATIRCNMRMTMSVAVAVAVSGSAWGSTYAS
jgi:hypothetical protein